MADGSTLIFVYNADSGLFNALVDAAHKIFSPQTYRCHLCALTHAALGERRAWREFVSALGRPVEFLHADELRELYGETGARLPALFRLAGEHLELLISATEIDSCRTLDDLKKLVTGKL